MRFLAFCLMAIFTFTPIALAYPQAKLKECILSSKQSPIILGAPENSIRNFCDCALKLIVDEGKDDKSSVNICSSNYFK